TGTYSQRWKVSPGSPLKLLDNGRSLQIPAVFVVNQSSYDRVASILDCLQSSGGATVILERRGRFAARSGLGRYPGNVEVRLQPPMLLSKRGSLGAQPDYSTSESIGEGELLALAGQLANERNSLNPPPSHPFSFEMRFPPREPFSSVPISREKRLL